MGGSSIVWSCRGGPESASPPPETLPDWPLAAGAQSSRTRGISAVMSSAGEKPLSFDTGSGRTGWAGAGALGAAALGAGWFCAGCAGCAGGVVDAPGAGGHAGGAG
jgi:hypothetical protein